VWGGPSSTEYGWTMKTIDHICLDLEERRLLLQAASRRQAAQGGHWELSDLWNAVAPAHFGYPPHIQQLHAELQAVADGTCRRLIICMPPQHGKSTSASQMFPAYFMGRFPDRHVILASYSLEMAEYQAVRCKRFVELPMFQDMFPDVVPKGFSRLAATNWTFLKEGEFKAVGIHGGMTGRPAYLYLIDDPLKNRAEAMSETIREDVWDCYLSSVYTRQNPNTAIVIIMTRWHPEDLVGKVLAQMEDGGEEWKVVSMATSAQNPLWPGYYSSEELERKRITLGPFEWASLYLQEPTLRGGNRFKVDKSEEYPGVVIHETVQGFPDGPWVRFWDPASTAKQRDSDSPDWTASIMACVTYKDGDIPVLWAKRAEGCQAEAPARDELMRKTVKKDGLAVRQVVEGVAGYKDVYTTLKSALDGKAIVDRAEVKGDKTVNAADLEPVVAAGNCHILRDRFTERLLGEMREFPAGRHDDFANSLWAAFQAARGPAEHAAVFARDQVHAAYDSKAYAMPEYAKAVVGIAYSEADRHRCVIVAKDGARYHVVRSFEISGAASTLAKEIAARSDVEPFAALAVMDDVDPRATHREVSMAGLSCRSGFSETNGVTAIRIALEDKTLAIHPDALTVVGAVEQFHRRERKAGEYDANRAAYNWAGPAGYVRALGDALQLLRFEGDTSETLPQTDEQIAIAGLPSTKRRELEKAVW